MGEEVAELESLALGLDALALMHQIRYLYF